MEKLISILIPTYNVEKFVEKAILSILNQTHKNIEVIIVDDGSTDKTYNILTKLASIDNRIKLFRNESNKRIAVTLNLAISKSKGSYIARMDGDDISKPERLAVLYKYLEIHSNIDLVGSQMEVINEKGEIINRSTSPIIEQNVISGLKYKMSTVAHIWLARKKVYDTLKEYRIPSVEDYDFLLRLVTAKIRFTNVPEYLYQVRIRQGNTATTYGLKQRLLASYCYNLYKERLMRNDNLDSYSYEGQTKVLPNKLIEVLHENSNKFVQKAMNSRDNKLKLFVYLCSSLILSPYYQTQMFYYRYKIKRLK